MQRRIKGCVSRSKWLLGGEILREDAEVGVFIKPQWMLMSKNYRSDALKVFLLIVSAQENDKNQPCFEFNSN